MAKIAEAEEKCLGDCLKKAKLELYGMLKSREHRDALFESLQEFYKEFERQGPL